MSIKPARSQQSLKFKLHLQGDLEMLVYSFKKEKIHKGKGYTSINRITDLNCINYSVKLHQKEGIL